MAVRSSWRPGAGRSKVVRRSGAVVAAVTLAVVLVGCGSDDDGDADTTPATATPAVATTGAVNPYGTAPATGEAVPGSTGAPADAATVTIDDFAFDPADATFKVGQTVTVVNNDTAPHTWTSSDGGFDTGVIQPGGSTTVTLQKAGTFDVVCTLHPTMTGSVTVQP